MSYPSFFEISLPRWAVILLLLVIFTVTCALTAYLCMRPALRRLREARRLQAQQKNNPPEGEE